MEPIEGYPTRWSVQEYPTEEQIRAMEAEVA